MKTCIIYYANEGHEPTIIEDTNAYELNYRVLNEKAIAEGKGKINAIEFWFFGKTVGTVYF